MIARGADVQVKRLQIIGDHTLLVISDNRAYESEKLTGAEADAVQVCGLVLSAWTLKKLW